MNEIIQKYLKSVIECITNFGSIKEPNNPKKLGKLHWKNGKIVGWEIKNQEIFFWSDDYLDVDEYIEKDYILKSSYHFSPSKGTCGVLHHYRIDKDSNIAHANPCECEYFSELPKHLYKQDIRLCIEDVNILSSIYMAHCYIEGPENYPLLDSSADIYNPIIEGGKI